MIKTKNIVNVLIFLLYLSIFRLLEFGLQRNHFFRDISKLKFYMLELLFYSSFAADRP